MKENKIEVWKDKRGNLHESRDSYILAELEIFKDGQVRTFEMVKKIMKDNKLAFYTYLKKVVESAIENPESAKQEMLEIENMIKEAANIERRKPKASSDDSCSNPNWNDSPGEWLGISAQDMGIPNC